MATLESLVQRAIAVRTAAPAGRPAFLGIVGPPGAGKTTMSEALHRALPDWSVVQMDGFHLSNEVLIALGRRDRKGAPDTFDVNGFVDLLLRAHSASHVVYAPRFRREIEEPIASSLPVRPDSPGVIVEGNYLLLDHGGWEAVGPLLDACWYVDTPPEECRRRLVERATQTYGPIDGPAWVDTVDEPNAALVRATAPKATWRVVLD